MLSEKLSRVLVGDDSYVYVAQFHSIGARKRAYALYKQLKEWWKSCVDTTDEQGEVSITLHEWGGYHVDVRFTDEKNVVLFKLAFDHNETKSRLVSTGQT
ncbi:hypothetical protein [Paraburkholderia sp. BR10882]|uniref:hypothetical protein n=1 Tax=unclassified Paraburkholderia TaxID=2615204 RepID=UPI0034CEF7BD